MTTRVEHLSETLSARPAVDTQDSLRNHIGIDHNWRKNKLHFSRRAQRVTRDVVERESQLRRYLKWCES